MGTPIISLPYARTAMLALLLVSLGAGILVPVYTDEVAWRLQLSRFLLDGGVDRATGETCGANTIAVPPPWMWPVRAFSSGVTTITPGPLTVRLAGVTFAVAAVLLLRRLIARLEIDPAQRARMELVSWSLLGLGVLPLLLVWSRPEQPLWLALLIALLACIPPRSGSALRVSTRLAVITGATLAALCYHPKAVLYLPVFAAGAIVAGRRRPLALGAALAVIAAASWSAFGYWSHRFACPDDPALAAALRRENASMLLLGSGWKAFAGTAPRLLHAMLPIEYIRDASPKTNVMSQWLPEPPLPGVAGATWYEVCQLAWVAALLLGLSSYVAAWRDPARSVWRLALGGAIVACLLGWAMLQLNKNAYEAALFLPVALVGVLLGWSARVERAWTLLAPVLAVVSIASQVMLLVAYLPPLWLAERDGGYIANQPYSLSAFRYPRARIVAAGARCGLQPRAGLRRVLVDDLTYFAYARTTMPLHRLGVLGKWSGGIADPYGWLHSHGSPGAVLACAYLPPAMRAHAIATEPFCCVNTG